MSLLMNNLYRFVDFELDADRRLLRGDGKEINLPPKAFDVLLYLVRNPQRPIPKEELLGAVWPDRFVEEANLSQNIFLLRKALSSAGCERCIVTLPGRGYQFAVPVQIIPSPQDRAEETEDSAAPATSGDAADEVREDGISGPALLPPAEVPPSPARPGRWVVLVTCSVVVLTAAALFWWKPFDKPRTSQKIVLADFDNRTGDPDFDVVLNKALEIDLTQSPYMDVMSESEALATLHLMNHKETKLTGEIAREVCERDNRDVLLAGAIASLGHEYVLTLEAIDCGTGKVMTEAKADASSKETVLGTLDTVAARVRHGLGESAKSLKRFEIPVTDATTSSLEALKDYSIGEYLLGSIGKEESETLPLFLHAVEIDPQFAMAHMAIATGYYNLGEPDLAAPHYQKAFELSGQVSEKEKIYIRAHYYSDARQDIEEGIKAYQLWADTYPQDWGSWLNLAREYTKLGRYDDAIAAGRRAEQLDAGHGIVYTVLARAYLRAGRYAEAQSAAEQTIKLGKDTYNLHAVLLELAAARHDQPALLREANWGHGKTGEWYLLTLQARIAASAGQYMQAESLFRQAYEAAGREKLPQNTDRILIDEARTELQSGFPNAARETLRHVRAQATDNPSFLLTKAALGETSPAEHFLARQTNGRGGTLVTYVYVPQLNAALALQHNRPGEAVTALEQAAPYEVATGASVLSQRAAAYLREGRADMAAAEYRKVLAHPELDPTSPDLPLAHLGLARAEAQGSHSAASKAEYETLFVQWKNADKNFPPLRDAQREYAGLQVLR